MLRDNIIQQEKKRKKPKKSLKTESTTQKLK